MRSLWIAVAVLATLGGPAMAEDEPIQVDRPDFTDSALTVAPGVVQLEGGASWQRDEGFDEQDLGEALVRVGLAPRFELRVGVGSLVRLPDVDASGWDGGSLGLKVKLLDGEGVVPSTGVLVSAATPWGGGEVATDSWQPEAKLALSWELPSGAGLDANVGWNRSVDGDDHLDAAEWSVSGSQAFDPRTGFFLEYFGFSRESPHGDATHYLNTGVTYLLRPKLQLDAWARKGLVSAATDWAVGAGAAYRF